MSCDTKNPSSNLNSKEEQCDFHGTVADPIFSKLRRKSKQRTICYDSNDAHYFESNLQTRKPTKCETKAAWCARHVLLKSIIMRIGRLFGYFWNYSVHNVVHGVKGELAIRKLRQSETLPLLPNTCQKKVLLFGGKSKGQFSGFKFLEVKGELGGHKWHK